MGAVSSACCDHTKEQVQEMKLEVEDQAVKAMPAEAAEDDRIEQAMGQVTEKDKLAETVQEPLEKIEEGGEDAKSGALAEDVPKESVEEAAPLVEEKVEAPVEAKVEAAAETSLVTASLNITFEFKNKLSEVKFEQRPLGFAFGEQKKGGCCSGGKATGKVVVTKVDKPTHAKGVRVGMTIKKINDTEVSLKKEWVEFQEMMALAAKPLPEAPEEVPKAAEDSKEKAPEAAVSDVKKDEAQAVEEAPAASSSSAADTKDGEAPAAVAPAEADAEAK